MIWILSLLLATSLQQVSSTSQAHLQKGRQAFLVGQADVAARHFQAVIDVATPDQAAYSKARFALAECKMVQGRPKQAEDLYAQGIAGLDSEARREALGQRYWDLAEKLIQDASVGPDTSPDYDTARIYYQVAEALAQRGPLAQRAQLQALRCQLLSGQAEGAYARGLELLPQTTSTAVQIEILWLMAQAAQKMGQAAKARAHLRQIIVANTDSRYTAEAWLKIAESYGFPNPGSAADLLAGQQALQQFIDRYPTHPAQAQARWDFIAAAAYRGRDSEVLPLVKAFIERGAKADMMAKARLLLAQTYVRLQRESEADAAFVEFIKKHPDDRALSRAQQGLEDLHWQRALSAFDDEKWPLASKLLAVFVKQHPSSHRRYSALIKLGEAQHRQGQVLQAQKLWLKIARGAAPAADKNQALENLGLLAEEQGQFARARDFYREGGVALVDRLQILDAPDLQIDSAPRFALGDKVHLRWHARNIKAVQMRLYRIEAEDFFRDQWDMRFVTDVDVGLCQAEQSWSVPISGYQKHRLQSQDVPLPIERAGLYVVTASVDNMEARTAVLVSDLGLVVKTTPTELFVFAQDLTRQRPKGGLRILVADAQGLQMAGNTDSQGVFRHPLEKELAGDALKVLATGWDHIAWADASASAHTQSLKPQAKAFVMTDRPAYQKGDHVALAGFVRDRWGQRKGLGFVPGRRYFLRLLAPNGGLLVKTSVVADAFGAFSSAFDIDPSDALGTYVVKIASPSGALGSTHFVVDPFVTSPLDFQVQFARPFFQRGEPVAGVLRLLHRQGGVARDVAVEYQLDDEKKWRKARTDAQGQLAFSLQSAGLEWTQSLTVHFRAPAYRAVFQAQTVFAEQGVALQVAVEDPAPVVEQPVRVLIKAMDPLGHGLSTKVQLELFERLPKTQGERRIKSWSLTLPQSGTMQHALQVAHGGDYLLRAFAVDPRGHRSVVEQRFLLPDAKAQGLSIVVDPDAHIAGRPMSLTVINRRAKALVLLTQETDRIVGFRSIIVDKGATTLSLSLPAELTPAFNLVACDLQDDKLQYSAVQVDVTQNLSLRLRPDKEKYAPGDWVNLQVSAFNAQQGPVEARVILALVDASLLAVFPRHEPQLPQFFYPQRPLPKIQTLASGYRFPAASASMIQHAEIVESQGTEAFLALNAQRQRVSAAGSDSFANLSGSEISESMGVGGIGVRGQGAGGGGMSRSVHGIGSRGRSSGVSGQGMALLRQYFARTAAFLPNVQTAKNGSTQVRFRLPDNIGRWQVNAWGASAQGLMGQTQDRLDVDKSFSLQLVLPETLDVGDNLRPVARVFNRSEKDLNTTLTLSIDKQREVKAVQVAAGSVRELTFALHSSKATAPGQDLNVTLKAEESGRILDQVRLRVPVRATGLTIRKSAAGLLKNQTQLSFALAAKQVLPKLQLRLGPDPVPILLGLGEVNQWSSGNPGEVLVMFRGLAAQRRAARHLHKQSALQDTARRHLQRLIATQKNDGGFLPYRQAARSQLDASILAVHAMVLAQQDPGTWTAWGRDDSLKKAQRYLLARLTQLDVEDYDRQIEILYALAASRAQGFPVTQLHRLHRQKELLTTKQRATLGLTWLLRGDRVKAQQLVASLADFALTSSGLARARMLELKRRLKLFLARQEQNWLRDQALAQARLDWATRDAVLAVLAFDPAPLPPRTRVAILLGGQELRRVTLQGAQKPVLVDVDSTLLKQGDNVITLQLLEGDACAYVANWQATQNAFSSSPNLDQDTQNPALQRRISLVPEPYLGLVLPIGETTLDRPDPSWRQDLQQVAAGRQIEVELRIKPFAQTAAGGSSPSAGMSRLPTASQVIVETIPAGFAWVEQKILGPVEGYFIHGRQLALFVPQRSTEVLLRYRLQAINPGQYQFAPALRSDLQGVQDQILGRPRPVVIRSADATLKDPAESPDTLFARAEAAFSAGHMATTIAIHEQVLANPRLRPSFEVRALRSLLFAALAQKDLPRVLKYFELSKEKNPDLVVPFAQLDVVAQAYRSQKAFEAAVLLARGRSDAQLRKALHEVGNLDQNGFYQQANALLSELVAAFPDRSDNARSSYAYAQVLYLHRDQSEPESDDTLQEPEARKQQLFLIKARLLDFLQRFPRSVYAPPAIYSLATALLDLGEVAQARNWCARGLRDFAKDPLAPSFAYVKAYTHFARGEFPQSLALLQQVVDTSPDPESVATATYIMAQIHHARGQTAQALALYKKVAGHFLDAREVLRVATSQTIKIPATQLLSSREPPLLPIEARNIHAVDMRVYQVDLLELLQLKGDFAQLDQINLAGIRPIARGRQTLHGKLGETYKTALKLPLNATGAYLVRIRNDKLKADSLVLRGGPRCSLTAFVDEQRVRVRVFAEQGQALSGARVLLKGDSQDHFVAGYSDLRGVFVGKDVQGQVTAVVQKGAGFGLCRMVSTPASDSPAYDNAVGEKTFSFDDEIIEGETIDFEGPSWAEQRGDSAASSGLFDQEVEGMSVEQAR